MPGQGVPTPQPPPQVPQAPTVVTPQVVATVVPAPPSADVREGRIMRQTATKVAGIMLSHIAQEQRTFDNLLLLSERLVAYYEHGLDGTGEDPPVDDIPF